MMRKFISRILIFLVCFLLSFTFSLSAITVDEVPNVHVKDRSQYVSNPSGVLSSQAVKLLNERIARLWSDTSVELVVVAVDEIDSSLTPEEFATKLFEKWGIGKRDKDNGILVLLSRDDHAVQIRTGYGVEGALPDIIAGRIIRDNMFPSFREGNYDEGVIEGIDKIDTVLRDPELAEELKSKYANDSADEDDLSGEELFGLYIGFCAIFAVALLIIIIVAIFKGRGKNEIERYRELDAYNMLTLFASFFTLGLALPAYLLLRYKMHKLRRHKRNCPHCGTRMQLMDEQHDNDFLSPSQDLEEKLNSIDYDVWHCPKCSQTDIIPYINRSSNYEVCNNCGAKAVSRIERRIITNPSLEWDGLGEDIYLCKNCGNRTNKRFTIPKKQDDTAAIATGAILGSMLGGAGGRSEGGISGGSFGGGFTGGGGAGGRW